MSFAQEFQKLLLENPRYNLKQVNAENCDYADTALKSKNCYYCFCVFYCEDVYYGRYSRKCSNCSGVTFCVGCQWCNECVDCVNGYMLDYCRDCQNCSDCAFCTDCFGCINCFGCVGLYKKQYCLFNQQLTKEEYEKQIGSMNLNDEVRRAEVGAKVESVKRDSVNLGIHSFRTENCVGDHLSESKNCYQCYDSFLLEDCFYNIETNANKSCCDMTVCFENELCYNCVQTTHSYDGNFLFHVDAVNGSEFCAYSKNLKNCFGCVYLSDKENHILNKPYSPMEYRARVGEIREELMRTGKYNMSLYMASAYEDYRLRTETDSVIQN